MKVDFAARAFGATLAWVGPPADLESVRAAIIQPGHYRSNPDGTLERLKPAAGLRVLVDVVHGKPESLLTADGIVLRVDLGPGGWEEAQAHLEEVRLAFADQDLGSFPLVFAFSGLSSESTRTPEEARSTLGEWDNPGFTRGADGSSQGLASRYVLDWAIHRQAGGCSCHPGLRDADYRLPQMNPVAEPKAHDPH